MKDAVIILSGGMDSVTLLHEYKERIALAITFNYGSNHAQREIACAAQNCEELGIEHIIIPLDFMHQYFRSSLLQGGDAIPEGRYDEENMKSTIVPFRNGIMLSIAAGIADCRGLSVLMIANHAGDHAIYPDCRPQFIGAMGEAIFNGTGGVKIFAPYTGITKDEICARGTAIGVNYAHTYSCYKGGEKHCGKCGTCVERKEAFQLAGVPDPTEYED